MLLVKLGASQVVGFRRLHRNILRRVFRDTRTQCLVRQEMFERHIGVGGGNRGAAAREIEVNRKGNENDAKYQPDDEFHWLALPF